MCWVTETVRRRPIRPPPPKRRQLPSPNTGVFYLQIGDAVRWLESLDSGPLARVSEDDRWWSPLAARLGALVLASGLPRGGWLEQVSVLRIVQ